MKRVKIMKKLELHVLHALHGKKKRLYNNSSAIFRRNICTYYFFENLELFLERPIKYLFLRKKNYTRELHLPPIIPGISPKAQGLPA